MRIIFEGGEVLDLTHINKIILDADEEEVLVNRSIISRHFDKILYGKELRKEN